MNTLLPTTVVGSLPKPSWLAQPETLWSPWKLEGEALLEGKQDALRIALHEQSRRGIDIVSDGEQTRQHFVTTFIEHLSGVDFEQRKTVRIRDRYDASVPTVVGAVRRERPVFVEDAKFLRAATDQPIKWTLPGPMTMVDTLFDDHYKSREKLAWEFATILNQEAKELEAAGVDIIQFDEPAFNVFLDEVKDWGVAALERAAEGLRAETAVHICYGYGIKANTDWKATLGSQWRQYEESFPLLQSSSIDIISLECQNSHVPMDLIELLRGKKVMLGAIDVASETIETPEEVADTLRKALKFVDADKLIPSSNCGMAPFPRDVALAKLSALSAGTNIIREELARSAPGRHNDVSRLPRRHLVRGSDSKLPVFPLGRRLQSIVPWPPRRCRRHHGRCRRRTGGTDGVVGGVGQRGTSVADFLGLGTVLCVGCAFPRRDRRRAPAGRARRRLGEVWRNPRRRPL